MSARETRLVIEREVREATRRKGVWALLALIFLGSAALVVVPDLLPNDDSVSIGVVGDDPLGIRTALEALPERSVDITPFDSRDEASAAVGDGVVDLAIVFDQPTVMLVDDATSSLVALVGQVVATTTASARLDELGIDPDQVNTAFAESTPVVQPVDADRNGKQATAFGLVFVLYLLTVILTSQVANGVAVEKTNRVSEVLLAIVPPRSLLFGKVIGVGCIGVATILAGAVPVIVKMVVGGDLPQGVGTTLAQSSVWFVGGLALYLTVAGALGALVSRQEEVGAVVTPLTMLLVFGYVIAFSAGDSVLARILAYVPLLSPLIEPYRIATGRSSPTEYVVSLAILMVTIVFTARFAEVVYRRAIVRTGRRLKLREVLSSNAAR